MGNCPHIVVGTPGRILALIRSKKLPLKNLKHFVLDECDKMLEQLDMRRDVQEIFRATPHEKQVMMFSHPLQGHQTRVQEVHARRKTLLNCSQVAGIVTSRTACSGESQTFPKIWGRP